MRSSSHTAVLRERLKIVVVDDDESVCETVTQALREHGYHVESRPAATNVLTAFNLNPAVWDVVITDMHMPFVNGLEFIPLLKDICPHVIIIGITADPAKCMRAQALRRGAAAYLVKPFDLEELIQMLRFVDTLAPEATANC